MIASLFIAALGFVLIFLAFQETGLIILASNVSTHNYLILSTSKWEDLVTFTRGTRASLVCVSPLCILGILLSDGLGNCMVVRRRELREGVSGKCNLEERGRELGRS